MARVNISMPDELLDQARRAGLNVSQLAQRAVRSELSRLAKAAALDSYLADLEAEQGPIGQDEQSAATAWADQALGRPSEQRSA